MVFDNTIEFEGGRALPWGGGEDGHKYTCTRWGLLGIKEGLCIKYGRVCCLLGRNCIPVLFSPLRNCFVVTCKSASFLAGPYLPSHKPVGAAGGSNGFVDSCRFPRQNKYTP